MFLKHLSIGRNAEQKNSFNKNYIHFNPCKGNKLVDLPEQYEHSSAKYYIEGVQGIYPVTSFMELRDIDLTRLRT